jgi:hypothetical protein
LVCDKYESEKIEIELFYLVSTEKTFSKTKNKPEELIA